MGVFKLASFISIVITLTSSCRKHCNYQGPIIGHGLVLIYLVCSLIFLYRSGPFLRISIKQANNNNFVKFYRILSSCYLIFVKILQTNEFYNITSCRTRLKVFTIDVQVVTTCVHKDRYVES